MDENQGTTGTSQDAASPVGGAGTENLIQDLIQTYKAALSTPKVFFANMPLSGGMQPPVMFYLSISVVNAFFMILFKLNHPVAALMGGIGALITLMVASFIGAGVTMLIAKALGGNGNYEQTYRAVSYAAAPHVLGWFPIVNAFAGLYALFLLKLALERAHNLSSNKAIAVVAIQVGIAIIIAIVFMILGFAAMIAGH
jgi:hypothetical protein